MNFRDIENKYNVCITDIGGTFIVEADEMAIELGLPFDVDGAKKTLSKMCNCGNITIR